jgi:sporulation integral membrane protein YtvI
LVKEVRELINDMPVISQNIKIQFDEMTQAILRFSKTLPANIQTMINNLIDGVGNYASNLSKQMEPVTMKKAGNFVQNIAEGFLGLIVVILSAYFFAAGRNDISAKIKKNIPASVTSYWHLIFDNFKAAFGGYFKAQFKIMLVITIIMFIGFEILKVGYSFLFALGIAFLDVLPVFGTGAILWPWAIIDMFTGNYIRAIGLVVIYLICQVLKQILQPKMVGDSIGLHPLATLFFMFVGYRFYGVFGMIIGIPVGMVLVKLYRIGLFDRTIRGFQIIAKDLNEFRKY